MERRPAEIVSRTEQAGPATWHGAQSLSETDLLQFVSQILSDDPDTRRHVNEARFGLSRLLPLLAACKSSRPEVLEVGAGSCILSAYLASKGLRMTALEPLVPEFDFFTDLQNRVLDFCRHNKIELNLLRTTGEALDALDRFDVAFTINALEHMREPLRTIDNMYNSLRSGGVLLAHCPNYAVPFDSHFNILLITRSKGFNEWLYRSTVDRDLPLWNELNFIRYVDVRRHLKKPGRDFTFNRAVMRDLVTRLFDDPIFAERMPAPVRAVGAGLRYSGLLNGLTLIPPRFQTPMEVVIRKD
jgi:SAM-dependent methyltransferase